MPDGRVAFSSSVLVDDASTPTSRFTTFYLDPDSAQVLQSIRNRLTSGKQTAMSFRGRSLLSAMGNLEDVECRGVLGGAPRQNMAGYREAVAMEGELVTVTLTLDDGTETSQVGIVTDLTFNNGPGGRLAQGIDLVFHPCDRLRFIKSSTYLTNPSV